MGIRVKLVIALGGLLLILAVVGVVSIHTLNESSKAIERILRENYDSVSACDSMKVAIDKLDSLAEFLLWGNPPEALQQRDTAIQEFSKNLKFQQGNVTLPGEQDLTDRLTELWKSYRYDLENFHKLAGLAPRRELYRQHLLPQSREVRETAQEIIRLNLDNMVAADGQVKQQATQTRKAMLFLLFVGIVMVVGFLVLVGPAILDPIASLIRSVREIQKGNLDLVVNVHSRDEIGQLGEAFNQMAASLRELRRSDQANLLRAQRSTKLALDSLSDAVAILNPHGVIELANETAQRLFGLRPESTVRDAGNTRITEIFARVCQRERPFQPRGYDSAIQIFKGDEEHFFLPHAVPIFDAQRQLVGVTLMLTDVTRMRRLDEVKTGLISTVSHELKTPLTSIRLAIHLVLSEKIGDLSAKQVEVLEAAREDSDRLYQVIEDLLDISRIESGQAEIQMQPVNVQELVLRVTDKVRPAFLDHRITLKTEVAPDVPQVLADPSRLSLVFDNLLSNALKYTPTGGEVRVTAKSGDGVVRFTIEDTGVGIASDYVSRIFEKFFRVPGQEQASSGLGLTIAKEIVEAHGGTIGVASQVGQGTTFTVDLKAAEPAGSKLSEHSLTRPT
jgi:NtrC-family two-component system sensor histidine kinase KinB